MTSLHYITTYQYYYVVMNTKDLFSSYTLLPKAYIYHTVFHKKKLFLLFCFDSKSESYI